MTQPDFTAARIALRKDPIMRALMKRHGNPDFSRYSGDIDIFHSLMRSIISQQISSAAARSIHARVLALFPGSAPTPQAFAKRRVSQLRAAGLSEQKIIYIRDLAKRCLDGTVDESRFSTMTSQEIIDHLVVVKGVGVWTAQMMLIFRLHRFDVLPVGDLAIRKGFMYAYNLKKEPTKKQMETIARPWIEYASVASWYLWAEYSARGAAKSPQKKTPRLVQ